MNQTPALMTDMYEYTMLEAALKDGSAARHCVFELFARHLPAGRRYGVAAGLGRVIELIENFHLDESDLSFLLSRHIISRQTADWLGNFHFSGTIRAYREGEVYFPNSPILQVEGNFGECTLLETLLLSVLNYDSAVAAAASRMSAAAGRRPCLDMGGRRINEHAAIAAARAAIVGGFVGTSNLAAAQKYDLPAIGTAAHSFTLLHDSEQAAFQSQIAALGKSTTVLTDTYNIETAITTAVAAAGPELGAIRIDSGDLASLAQKARKQLDALGARNTKITVTNDLDEYALAALATAPVDSYGVGTRLVTGSGIPTCSMVYKLVEREGANGQMQPVAKKSFGKVTDGWRKRPVRAYQYGLAQAELVVAGPAEQLSGWHYSDPDSVSRIEGAEQADQTGQSLGLETRDLFITAIDHGDIDHSLTSTQALLDARSYHQAALAELPITALSLSAGEPAIPTEVITLE